MALGFAGTSHGQECVGMVKTKDKANKLKFTMQRAQPACINPTTTVMGGIPACTGVDPTPSSDFAVSPSLTKSKLQLQATKTGDVSVSFAVSGLLESDQTTLADGTATLLIRARFIVVNPLPDLGGYNLLPIPITTTFPVTAGKGGVKTSLNTMLADLGFGPLPACFKMEIEELGMLDGAMGPVLEVGTTPLFSEKSSITYGSKG